MRALLPFLVFVAFATSNGQDFEISRSNSLPERLSVTAGVSTFYGRNDYGSFGSALVEASMLSLSQGVLFGGDISAFAGGGLGARYRKGDLHRPLALRGYTVGISIPLLNIGPIVRMNRPLQVKISPYYQKLMVRNYNTGNHNPSAGWGLAAGITAAVTDYLALNVNVNKFSGEQPKAGFLWDTGVQSAGISLTVNVGRFFARERQLEQTLRVSRRELDQRYAELVAVRGERDSLMHGYRESRDSLFRVAARLSDWITRQPERTGDRKPVITSAAFAAPVDLYDEDRKAPVQVIKIDKVLFRGKDLVEEAYLKAILSIVSKHSAYVWEIVHRDQGAEGAGGRILAEKISQFFQIYDSALTRRLTISRDGSLRTEFEIRCKGLALPSMTQQSEERGE